ncbi:MAG: hypothetical protein WCA52_15115 [Candidatus Aquilonibacter sp.]
MRGPSAKLRTATNISASDPYEMTIHWDGDRPLFITDSTGALVQLSVETLGGTTYLGQSPYFFVLDRDFSGTQVSAHDSNGDDGPWEYGQLYSHVIGKGATVQSGGWVGSTNAAGDSLVLAPAREDGYAVRGLMIQGVRSYDSNTEQWTTPDAYKGDVHDPMSQRSYMWNNNNPVAYSDPSGYCPWCIPVIIEFGEDAMAAEAATAAAEAASAARTAQLSSAALKAANWASENSGALGGIARVLFRSGEQEVPGGTAGAVRSELAGKGMTNGSYHLQKGAEELGRLRGLLQSNSLSKGERIAADAMYRDLKEAFGQNDPAQFINNNKPPVAKPAPQPNSPPQK